MFKISSGKIFFFRKIDILQYVPEEKMSLVVTVSEGVWQKSLVGIWRHTEEIWFGK
jgi:hypothetical protein